MKVLQLLYILSLVLPGCTSHEISNPQKKDIDSGFVNVFGNIQYDSVVAFNYNGEAGKNIIDDSGHLSNKIHKRIFLQKNQIQAISSILCNPSTYGGDMAACFDPHLGIVYYIANKPKAFVSICLDCNSLNSSIPIQAANSGFSDSGIVRIVTFQKGIGY